MSQSDEHRIQAQLLKILDYTLRPEIEVYAIVNEAKRSFRTSARVKAQGLKAGITDLVFLFPAAEGYVGWLEMKTPTGSLLTAQHGFKAICGRLGHRWAMARSVEEALAVLRGWNALKANADII